MKPNQTFGNVLTHQYGRHKSLPIAMIPIISLIQFHIYSWKKNSLILYVYIKYEYIFVIMIYVLCIFEGHIYRMRFKIPLLCMLSLCHVATSIVETRVGILPCHHCLYAKLQILMYIKYLTFICFLHYVLYPVIILSCISCTILKQGEIWRCD